MKTDRELLKLAAKAAGGIASDGLGGCYDMEREAKWNPLTDDGDALRLAVQLGLLIDVRYTDPVIAQYNCVIYWLTPLKSARIELGDLEPDPLAATRRAITRAAAELGSQS